MPVALLRFDRDKHLPRSQLPRVDAETGQRGFRPDLSVLALADGAVVGYVLAYVFEADTAATGVRATDFGQIGVLPAARGRGLAKATIAAALKAAAEGGCRRATLQVDSENVTGALGLYEGLFDDYFNTLADFYGLGEEEDYWGDDGYQWDEGDGGSYYGVGQSFEQEAESGNVNQSFNVSGGGDNSNQCVGIQGVANTGNVQNQIGVIQYGSAADDFEFEASGASITVSPNSFTSCDQRVNQAATASG